MLIPIVYLGSGIWLGTTDGGPITEVADNAGVAITKRLIPKMVAEWYFRAAKH
jgi:hypothetical protein